MTLKLTYQQFTALYQIFKGIQNKIGFDDMWDKLLHIELTGIYQKLYQQDMIIKKKYRVKLTPAQAIAFYIVLNENNLPAGTLEGNLLRTINDSIHQKFA